MHTLTDEQADIWAGVLLVLFPECDTDRPIDTDTIPTKGSDDDRR